ncbi:hypothetical protein ARMGADRAFT_1076506 [Armillaria gallica]|uniref:Uncharacterized protein n=1 Tax=Armillaria gallica TaxID=47427 RepID=A0A2H3DR29_ARMGA|nr:hypothetical protein ARMGADRAFT_1076506 [Armillaria gallica]
MTEALNVEEGATEPPTQTPCWTSSFPGTHRRRIVVSSGHHRLPTNQFTLSAIRSFNRPRPAAVDVVPVQLKGFTFLVSTAFPLDETIRHTFALSLIDGGTRRSPSPFADPCRHVQFTQSMPPIKTSRLKTISP